MAPDLLLIHTIPILVEVFDKLCRQTLSSCRWLHVLDEPLLERVRGRGRLAPEDAERVLEHLRMAEELGVRLALITCSTISPVVELVRAQTTVSLLEIDRPMLRTAVEIGPRIGVFATNPTTVEPTRQSLMKEADNQGKAIRIMTYFVEGALEALRAGDWATHDQAVAMAVAQAVPEVDTIVLAQATMARCRRAILANGCRVPVLFSPDLAMREVAAILAG